MKEHKKGKSSEKQGPMKNLPIAAEKKIKKLKHGKPFKMQKDPKGKKKERGKRMENTIATPKRLKARPKKANCEISKSIRQPSTSTEKEKTLVSAVPNPNANKGLCENLILSAM